MKKFIKNFVLLCDDAIIGQKGKVSIIGIFEKVYLTTLPGTLLKSVLVGNFDVLVNSIENIDLRVDLLDEKNTKLGLSAPTVELKVPKPDAKKRRIGFMLVLGNLKFENYGTYKFVVTMNSEITGEYSFEVQKLPQQDKNDK